MKRLFSALEDRTRLRLLNLMSDREICVCYFVEVLQAHQPKVSRHLAYLRRAGLVTARRQGKWMHYRLAVPSDQYAARILTDVLQWLSADPEMQRDKARFTRASCAPQKFVLLQGAPPPIPLHRSEPALAGRH
jgi:ArsR family transcriptional regulator